MNRILVVVITLIASAFLTFGVLTAIERGTKARQNELFDSIRRQEERLGRRFTRFARKHDDKLQDMQAGLRERVLDIQQLQAITLELSKYESDVKDLAVLGETLASLHQRLDQMEKRCCCSTKPFRIPNARKN